MTSAPSSSPSHPAARPRVAVLFAPGTNCHEETAFAIDQAGGNAAIISIHDTLAGDARLRDFEALVLPGGFSYGDHIAAGRVFAVQLIARLRDQLAEFAARRPVLGICNGYQVLMEAGLLPSHAGDADAGSLTSGQSIGTRSGALAQNRSARFESRWISVLVAETASFWTFGLEGKVLRLPVAHAEGRMIVAPGVGARPAFSYVDDTGAPTESYPLNPAGSCAGTAGIVDASGLALGLMPHPERAAIAAQGSTDGLAIFQNLVRGC